MGTGGGGNPYIGKLRAQEVVNQHGNIKVIQAHELNKDDLVICLGGIGAPTVGVEKVRGPNYLADQGEILVTYLKQQVLVQHVIQVFVEFMLVGKVLTLIQFLLI